MYENSLHQPLQFSPYPLPSSYIPWHPVSPGPRSVWPPVCPVQYGAPYGPRPVVRVPAAHYAGPGPGFAWWSHGPCPWRCPPGAEGHCYAAADSRSGKDKWVSEWLNLRAFLGTADRISNKKCWINVYLGPSETMLLLFSIIWLATQAIVCGPHMGIGI